MQTFLNYDTHGCQLVTKQECFPWITLKLRVAWTVEHTTYQKHDLSLITARCVTEKPRLWQPLDRFNSGTSTRRSDFCEVQVARRQVRCVLQITSLFYLYWEMSSVVRPYSVAGNECGALVEGYILITVVASSIWRNYCINVRKTHGFWFISRCINIFTKARTWYGWGAQWPHK